MFEFYFQFGRARRKLHKVQSNHCSLGSARGNDLVIDLRGVAKRHLEIIETSGEVFVHDLGSTSGTWVNRERVRKYGPLTTLDEIVVGEVHINLHRVESSHVQDASTSQLQSTPIEQKPPGRLSSVESVETGSVAVDLIQGSSAVPEVPVAPGIELSNLVDEEMAYWGKVLHDQLLSDMDLQRKDISRMSDKQLQSETGALIDNALERLSSQIPEQVNIAELRVNVLNEAVGLGPLEGFLADDLVTEIMVNNHREIYVEKAGRLEKSAVSFSSNEAVYAVIERIITPIGRRIDESSPIVDARLKDGSRVNAVIPPLALKGPSLTIRKFPRHRLSFDDLVSAGSVNQSIVDFLQICVEMRKNIVVSGGTGSGKTTLLNVLSNFIPARDRVVTIEDAAELKLVQPNLVSLESRPSNLEGRGAITIRELVKNALRMRPDRIVVGECRGGEAIDMLQAMNTGHDGSLTTIHANNPRDVISRLEVLVLMAGIDLPVSAIREQIASAVNLIIQQTRFPCGSRKITRVTEVVGVESGTIQLQDIFIFKQTGRDAEGNVVGHFQPSGFIPSFYETLAELGHKNDVSLFERRSRDSNFDDSTAGGAENGAGQFTEKLQDASRVESPANDLMSVS